MSAINKRVFTVRKVRNRMIILYTFLILLLAAAGGYLLLHNIKKTDNTATADQTKAVALGTAAGIDCFCENAEADCNRVFRNNLVMDFDPVTKIYHDYEGNAMKNNIKDELLALAAGKNYNDFFLLFSDSTAIGKVSGSADVDILQSNHDHSSLLGEDYDSWIFSPSGGTRKMYYLRKITDHSMFVLSFYIDEFDKFIYAQDNNSSDTIVLADHNDDIIMTNLDLGLNGAALPEYSLKMFKQENETVISDEYIGSTVSADCGFKIYVITKNSYNFSDTAMFSGVIVMIAAALTLIAVFTGMIGTAGLVLAEINASDTEYYDPMTGRLNEYGLDEKISELLETSLVGSTYAMIMVGIKDAELVLPTMSASYRKSVCKRLIAISEEYLGDRDYYIGRTAGDRIVILADFCEFDLFKAHDDLKKFCNEFCRQFESFTADSSSTLKMYVNLGVCVYPDHAEDYDSLVEKSEQAFFEAEKQDGSSVVIYEPKNDDNGKNGKDGDNK